MSKITNLRPELNGWRQKLTKEDRCPYVGPRPQTIDDERMLIGRGSDLERITEAVLDRPLIVLTGLSGIGKSSLLQNGLYGRLRMAGFVALISQKWPMDMDASGEAPTTESDVERYLARGILESHTKGRKPIPLPTPEQLDLDLLAEQGGLAGVLGDAFGGAAVLILDQFEELLRHQAETARRIVDWVIETGYHDKIRILISLRTDSAHLLDGMLRGVRPFSMDRVDLKELKAASDIEQVVRTMESDSTSRITGGAVARIMELWRVHQPKLLELQATLYSLYFRSRTQDDTRPGITTINADAVKRFEAGAKPGETPFEFGLRDAIGHKIDHAAAACRKHKLDDYLISGTEEVARRVAPLLSSGGFKVLVPEVELAQRGLDRELRVLQSAFSGEFQDPTVREGRRGINAAVREIFENMRAAQTSGVDLLNVRFEQVTPVGYLGDEAVRSAAGAPGRRHSVDVSSGPMMGASATQTLFEEIRRVAFAIEWLVETDILRKDPGGILLLIHDGAGEALRAWADAYDDDPTHALRQITGARGEHYVWKESEIGGDEYAVQANVSWRDCRITTGFRNVVFVNCDFSGSRFDGCTFAGVTFVNCLLDDANFEYCAVVGATALTRVRRKESEIKVEGGTWIAPSFRVGCPVEEVSFFAPYVGAEADSAEFFSDTSGKPAKPGPPPPEHLGEVVAHFAIHPDVQRPAIIEPKETAAPPVTGPAVGGVAMVGGRLCFLTIARCTSEKGGSFAFHHVSGAGLDIVEQMGGALHVHDGAIRGVSVTRDREKLGKRAARIAPIHVRIDDSRVVNLYFADGLNGELTFDHSVVFMLINANDNSETGFQVLLRDTRYEFLVNTHRPDGRSVEESSRLPQEARYFEPIPKSASLFDVPNRRHLAVDLETMDYRFHPELWEDYQRERRAEASNGEVPERVVESGEEAST